MMIIRRKRGQEVRIGDSIVMVGKIAREYMPLVISAPRSTPIVRVELVRHVRLYRPLRHVLADLIRGPLVFWVTIG